MLSALSVNIPFPNHSQYPRNAFSCQQTKQAVGVYSKIDSDSITVEAELFSLDGSQRFYEKQTNDVKKFKEIGLEIGKILKTQSNNSYKR